MPAQSLRVNQNHPTRVYRHESRGEPRHVSSAHNLLNGDDPTIECHDLAALKGIDLDEARNFGRRFELGAVFDF